jgi:adenosine kinase
LLPDASSFFLCLKLLQDASDATGTCAVLLFQGERSLIANLAAANNFAPEHLRTEKAQSLVDAAKYVYFAGFFLTVRTTTDPLMTKPMLCSA